MGKRQSQVEKAIASLEAERAVLDAAINRLRQQIATTPARKPRVKAKPQWRVEEPEMAR